MDIQGKQGRRSFFFITLHLFVLLEVDLTVCKFFDRTDFE